MKQAALQKAIVLLFSSSQFNVDSIQMNECQCCKVGVIIKYVVSIQFNNCKRCKVHQL